MEKEEKESKAYEMEELQEQAKREIRLWLDHMQAKRQIFRERLVKYVDQDKDEGKVWINTIYSVINLAIAIRLSDEANVLFMPRQFGDEEYAENLTNLAKYDYEEMGLSQLDYARHWDTSFFWYSIRKKAGRDDVKQCMIIEQVDPLTRIPDPYSDYLTPARFHYFEKEMLKSSMTEDRWFDEIKVKELTNQTDSELQNNKSYRNEAGWLNDIAEDTVSDYYISVYDWFTYFDWDLYLVTLAQTWELIRAEKIETVRKEEKKSWFIDIRTQVTVERFSPVRWNVIWVSMVDLIIDKQTTLSKLLNLRVIDAQFSTFWQTNLVNTDIVKNTTELTKPSINTKWIWVNAWWQNLSNAVYPVPRQSIMQDSYNVSNELSKQIQLDTWISENTLWVAEKGLTLWQSQQVQANANIKLWLWINISNWWEKDFWNYIWLRWYEEYFSKSEKKMIRVSNWFWVNVIEIRRDNFLWWANPDIVIDSKKKVETENEKMKANFLAMLPYFTNDPSKPKVVKNLALRYALKLQWMSREMINALTYDPTEEKAKMLVHILNANDMSWAEIEDLGEDHLTYMLIFESALDTPAKRLAIQNRRNAYIISWQVMQQWASAEWWMVNQSQASMTANAISQWSKWNVNLWQV